MQITIPSLSLVLLIGPSGADKSTFAQAHFRPTEVVSAEFCRGLLADDENDQSITAEAFDLMLTIARKRLAAGRLTVIDATSVQPEARRPLVVLAKEHDVLPVAIVFNLPELGGLHREGFRQIHTLDTPERAAAATVVRQPLCTDKRGERGPFDIIGDVHGCADELRELLARLGYAEQAGAWGHPAGRRAIFLGDLVDRGPDTPGVLRIVMDMAAAGAALCVPGNHDVKLLRKLRGRDVRVAHGLAESLDQLGREPPEFVARAADFIDGLVSHYVLDEGRLVVAHAGMKQQYQGRASGRVREFALYGETTGESDEFGMPVRLNWAADYRGPASVVYGHTPVLKPEWQNRTINIDTGCVFGGQLTALRYPERELVSVPARQAYATPGRPIGPRGGGRGGAEPDGDLSAGRLGETGRPGDKGRTAIP
jgi:protein phosphatase